MKKLFVVGVLALLSCKTKVVENSFVQGGSSRFGKCERTAENAKNPVDLLNVMGLLSKEGAAVGVLGLLNKPQRLSSMAVFNKMGILGDNQDISYDKSMQLVKTLLDGGAVAVGDKNIITLEVLLTQLLGSLENKANVDPGEVKRAMEKLVAKSLQEIASRTQVNGKMSDKIMAELLTKINAYLSQKVEGKALATLDVYQGFYLQRSGASASDMAPIAARLNRIGGLSADTAFRRAMAQTEVLTPLTSRGSFLNALSHLVQGGGATDRVNAYVNLTQGLMLEEAPKEVLALRREIAKFQLPESDSNKKDIKRLEAKIAEITSQQKQKVYTRMRAKMK